jgi:transcriptional regulator with XRE-family HTH domain
MSREENSPPHGRGLAEAGIGPRLRALRRARDVTLTGLSAETGISLSTLSRLESDRRRPTLEQALSLAHAHRVSVDELVATDDLEPSVRLRVITRRGLTLLRLTDRPGGLQAYKILVPVAEPGDDIAVNREQGHGRAAEPPQLHVHEGRNWLCVLAGRLRLMLGEHDLVLATGEVAEYDAHTPHWYAAAGPGPAEILAIFGAQGETLRPRAHSSRSQPGRSARGTG